MNAGPDPDARRALESLLAFWADAGVGAGGMLGVILLAGETAALVAHRPRRRATAARSLAGAALERAGAAPGERAMTSSASAVATDVSDVQERAAHRG